LLCLVAMAGRYTFTDFVFRFWVSFNKCNEFKCHYTLVKLSCKVEL